MTKKLILIKKRFLITILFIITIIFYNSLFIVLISAQNYYDDYSDVLLVCNNASADSLEICDYFITKRLAKDFNVSHVVNLTGISTAETVDCSVYTSIKDQINTTLQNVIGINYIVTTKGVPLRACGLSVDSKLTYAFGDNHNYFNKEDIFSSSKYGGYLVTRLDGPSVQDIKNLIDNSDLAAFNGYFLINKYSTSYSYDYGCTDAYNNLISLGFSAELNNSLFVTNRTNLTGYWSWGSNSGSNANSTAWNLSFNPGAIGETAVSTSARTLHSLWGGSGQSLISDLIRMNITGVKGYVYEPYLSAVAFPDILFDRYVNGYNLADSYYMSSWQRNWMDVIIGDPKTYIITNSLKPSITLNNNILDGERINNGTILNFSIYSTNFANISVASYNFNGTNLTFVSNYTINTTEWVYGDYSLNIYVNDTIGNVGVQNYNFTINATTGLTPFYNRFDGNTTDFKTLEDRTNVSNIILEQTIMGKIEFLVNNLNVSGLDLDTNVIFTSNSVTLNATALKNLNVSANISLYNSPGFSIRTPVILRDGVICNSTTTPACNNLTSLNASTIIFNVTSFTTYQISGDLVSGCAILNQPNTYYTLVNNISSTSGTCINITAENVTFDGNGYRINGTFTNAIYSNQYNSTIKNTIINSATGTTGIYLLNSDKSSILNNNITITTATSYGIQLETSTNANISNNFISSNFLNIYLKTTSTNNNIINNNLTGSTVNTGGGIFIYTTSTGNTVEYNTIKGNYPTTNSKGFYIRTNNNILIGNNITNTYTSYYFDTNAVNNTILSVINSTNYYNEFNVVAGSQVFRKWYYQAYVNDTNSLSIPNANITSYDTIGATEFSGLMTNSTGWTNITTITDYVNNGGAITYYSNYTINAKNYTSPPYYVAGQNFTRNITLLNNLLPDVMTLTYDLTLPNATLLTPVNNSFNNTDQNFTTNLTDNYGLMNATLHIFNSTNSEINTTLFAVVSGTLQQVVGIVVVLVDDAYTWFVDVFDLAGNNATSQNYTFTKDTTNPLINIIFPLQEGYISPIIYLNYTVIEIHPSKCWYSNDSGLNNYSVQDWNVSYFNISVIIDGEYNYTIYCNDTLNNLGNSLIFFTKYTPSGISNYVPGITANYSIQVNLIPHYYKNNIETNSSEFDSVRFEIEVYNLNTDLINNLKVIDSSPKLGFDNKISILNPNETNIFSESIITDISHYEEDVIYKVQIKGQINGIDVYGYGEKVIKINKPPIENSMNTLFWMISIIFTLLILYYVNQKGWLRFKRKKKIERR